MIEIKKHGTRDFALYEDGVLLAVVRYRKGAEAIKKRIESLQQYIREIEAAEALMPKPQPDEP